MRLCFTGCGLPGPPACLYHGIRVAGLSDEHADDRIVVAHLQREVFMISRCFQPSHSGPPLSSGSSSAASASLALFGRRRLPFSVQPHPAGGPPNSISLYESAPPRARRGRAALCRAGTGPPASLPLDSEPEPRAGASPGARRPVTE